MVKGLEVFREHFRNYADRYVLIGGAACDIAMTGAGLAFRATKDLDIVLYVEALDTAFVQAFWGFVRAGGYEVQEKSTGEKQFYRFQKPTVSILRSLITKQTWTPSEMNKGDTLWFSDASGAPLSNALQCRPESGEAWLPFGPVASDNLSGRSAKSTEGLMKPSTNSYAANCGTSIHLNLTPAESEDSVVTSVRYQVLDIKAMNAFRAKHPQH
jgi:hypothetical protein